MSSGTTVAIQGARGSFHHEAAGRLLAEPTNIQSCDTFAELFRALTSGQADYAVCAIENSLHGSINEVYRLLNRHNVYIAKDIRLQIHQNLIASQQTTLAELQHAKDVRVLSQAPALAQVELWLDKHLPDAIRIETHDTAASVAEVIAAGDPHQLAIAGVAALEAYGGHVIAANIEDDPQNYTRFVLLQREQAGTANANRASIILRTDHKHGALLRALQVFEAQACNLTKLDSHPIPGDMQHYAFYIDFEIGNPDHAASIIEQLEQHGSSVKLLGVYEHMGS